MIIALSIIVIILFLAAVGPAVFASIAVLIVAGHATAHTDTFVGGRDNKKHKQSGGKPSTDKSSGGLSADELLDVVRFHQQMAVLHPKYIARSFEVNDLTTMLPEVPSWIIRSNCDADATITAKSTDEIRTAYTKLAQNRRCRVLMSEDLATTTGGLPTEVVPIKIAIVRGQDTIEYTAEYTVEIFDSVPDKTTQCLQKVFTDLLPLVNGTGSMMINVHLVHTADGHPILTRITRAVGDQPHAGRSLAAVSTPVDNTPIRTFLYVGDKLEDASIAAYLPGWRRNTQMRRNEYVDLIIGAGSEMADPWLNYVPAHMKHRLECREITNKVNLHDNLMKLAPHTICETFHVDDNSVITDGTPWIVRAGSGFRGNAVRVVLNTEDLQTARHEFIAKNPKKNQTKEKLERDIIMSRYIQNPLLLNGHKFDVRVLLIAVAHSAEAISKAKESGRILPQKAVYMFRKYIITTAPKPYKNDDYSDTTIHISHASHHTDKVWFEFDEHFPGDKVRADSAIQQVLHDAIDQVIDKISKFDESAAGYEVLGADVMFDDQMVPRIAEINAIPSLRLLKLMKDEETGADYRPAYLDFLFAAIGGEFGIDVHSKHSVELVRRPALTTGGFHERKHSQHRPRNHSKTYPRKDHFHHGSHAQKPQEPADPAVLAAVEFPYHKLFKTEADVDRAFELIRAYRLKIVPADYTILNMPELTPADRQFRGRSLLVEMQASDYHTMNWVSDWFNEPRRVRCKRYDEPQTQLEYYTEHRAELINGDASYEQIHDAVYGAVRGCNNFRPGLLRGMIRATGAQSVLDISAGWGDRLIGAIAAGVRYVGVDPNPGVHEGYREIIDRFADGTSSPTKYTVIESPFETAELPEETFDLVMTSPPYFKLEIYTDAPGQSTDTHSTEDAWFDGFLMTSIKRAWDRLNPGGYLVMVINNTRGEPDYVIRMRDAVNAIDSADYQGVLPYAQIIKGTNPPKYKSPQPMWIWQKKASVALEPLSAGHIDRIVEITHDPGMKYVANGKPWTREKVEQLIKYSAEDAESPAPQYAHYVVMYGGIAVGYIGWYPLEGHGQNNHGPAIQLRVFISEFSQGRGFGLAAIRGLIAEKQKRYPSATLYMQMVEDNVGSVKLAQKAGFEQLPGTFPAGSTQVLRWKYVEKK